MSKVVVTYCYELTSLCGDGCCHENTSYVYFDDTKIEVGVTMFDYMDLVEYLTSRFGAAWSETYYIEENMCLFY